MSKKTDYGEGITITDWGEPEYLDGAQMQFMVTDEQYSRMGACLAYFSDKEDAKLFARMKADQKGTK